MSDTHDGGPAFFTQHLEGGWTRETTPGLSIRDYFAAKAMQGLMANPGGPIQASGMSGWSFTNCDKNDVAELAFVIADAMLKARSA